MIRLIVGLKGSGKTTRLIEMVNEAVAAEKGDVIWWKRPPSSTMTWTAGYA